MRELRKTIVYILLSIGAIVMLAPFAWMLVTSFKLPSEVNTWPPKWTTRSFATSREIKVIPSTGTATNVKGLSLREALSFVAKKSVGLNLSVNDDPFYRGELTIPTKGAKYTPFANLDEFNAFVDSLTMPIEVDKETPEKFFEEVYLYYINGSSPFFKRDEFTSNILGNVDNLLSTIDMISTYGIDRIEDQNEKERFQNFLSEKVKQLTEIRPKFEKFKVGLELVLSNDEISEIAKLLDTVELLYPGQNEVSENYNTGVENTLLNIKRNVDFFLKVNAYFSSIQNDVVDKDIKAVPMSKDEKVNTLLERTKDFRDFNEIKELITKVELNTLGEELAKKLDDEVVERYKISSLDLSNLKSLISSLINLGLENNLPVRDLLNVSFDEFSRKLEESAGMSLTYMSVKSKLDSFKESVDNAAELFKDVAINTLEFQDFRSIYESVNYAWKIIEAPSFVKEVIVKEGKNVEIIMDGVSPIYFIDDNIRTLSLKFTTSDVVKNVFQNYVLAWQAAPFGIYYVNTVFVAVVTTILEIIISAMAAYAFSWMNFPGRDLLFSIFLATMMVPGEVLLVPNFITITKFGWIDTYYALIVPWVVSVFSIFLMKQHFMSIPTELFDAARIDGCSHWRYLWQIVMPLSRPVVITTALLKFVGSWNSFLWVLIVTNDPKYRTLTVGLQAFSSDVGTLYNLLMAAATFTILPVVIIFLFTQRYFVRGIARTGLK
ncbi:MAG TPA: ABC transporter permease subunit [Fervidobacterium sp.]|nr:ABC transporter permease subunit [Fervidobacterium sp.]HOK33827.1 ABC transporter permease subunit [Fervidobacterium sp.]HPC80101.1 ABC transporter permease subunit [Fervidobacterium sp.]HQI09541.1 ABC transporter permease subunit [Fervidobacterium sp.]HRB91188.1 ABC transporter permease subunit [Fervidobacterium sp.]